MRQLGWGGYIWFGGVLGLRKKKRKVLLRRKIEVLKVEGFRGETIDSARGFGGRIRTSE